MVKVTLADGSSFHEPPYTDEEVLDGARRMNGGAVAFTRLSPRPAAPASQEQSEERQPQEG